MSLSEITSRCFYNGASPSKWVSLIQLVREKNLVSDVDFESNLSNSALALFSGNPADPHLIAYIKHALHAGILSLRVFVMTFLQAVKSPSLQNAATLEVLCKLILDAHYSGSPPIIRYDEDPVVSMAIIQDGLSMVRAAYLAAPHQPLESPLADTASQVLALLLSHIGDISQISTSQAMVYYADVLDVLQNYSMRVTSNLRTLLESIALSLNMILGDDAKMAQEAQMLQTFQVSLGRGDILGTNSQSDIVTLSLFLRYLVDNRASAYGSGDALTAASILVAVYRWMSWSPTIFYTQLYISAATCLAQNVNQPHIALLWRSFTATRLPALLQAFEKALSSESITEREWRNALLSALRALKDRTDILSQCDSPATAVKIDKSLPESDRNSLSTPPPLLRTILEFLVFRANLMNVKDAQNVESSVTTDFSPPLQAEALDSGLDIDGYIDNKLSSDTPLDDGFAFLQRVVEDFASHPLFANVVERRFLKLCTQYDAEGLGHLCKILVSHGSVLDIVVLHVKLADIMAHGLAVVLDFDCEAVGDPQTAVGHLGDVVLFLQYVSVRYQLSSSNFKLDDRVLRPDYLFSNCTVHRISEMSADEVGAFTAWFKALFDKNSEGIEDSILRATKPRTLLKISASLIMHAIYQCSERRMDREVLQNGISYFTGPLLNWTLVGVIKALIRDITYRDFDCPIHLEVLTTLLQSSTCPAPILILNGHAILSLVANPKAQNLGQNTAFNAAALRNLALKDLGRVGERSTMSPQILPLPSRIVWLEQPHADIREAITAARTGKAPCLEVNRSILVLGPIRFLKLLWAEINGVAQMGEMEVGRRLVTYALVVPPIAREPPLLPIFLCTLMPTLLVAIEKQMPAEQTISIELLVSIIASSLTGLSQMEWALRALEAEMRYPIGQPSITISRRLAMDLKRSPSGVASVIIQRLSASPSFVANFPMMAT